MFQTFTMAYNNCVTEFPVADGDYQVELYFKEPWWGIGGMNGKGWRVFDVAINNKTVIKDLDIWSKAGSSALKQVVDVHVTGGQLTISFPNTGVGQAVIAAIAIAAKDKKVKAAAPSPVLIGNLSVVDAALPKKVSKTWLNTVINNTAIAMLHSLHCQRTLYGAEWIQMPVIPAGDKLSNWASFV